MKLTVWPNGRFQAEGESVGETITLAREFLKVQRKARRKKAQEIAEALKGFLPGPLAEPVKTEAPPAPEQPPAEAVQAQDSMKTVRQWLETLPDGYRERAIANAVQKRLDEPKQSISEAIERAFTWASSPEGLEFWNMVYDSFDGHRDDLPPLPSQPEPEPAFRYFREDDGWRWKAPTDGGIASKLRPGNTEWEITCPVMELRDFVGPQGESLPQFVETDADGNPLPEAE